METFENLTCLATYSFEEEIKDNPQIIFNKSYKFLW